MDARFERGPVLVTPVAYWVALGLWALILALAISLVARAQPPYLAAAAGVSSAAATSA